MPNISIREFAKRDGCSHTLVRKALKNGHLSLLPDGKLDPKLVGSGWRKNNRRKLETPATVSTVVETDENLEEAAERILISNGAPVHASRGRTDKGKLFSPPAAA